MFKKLVYTVFFVLFFFSFSNVRAQSWIWAKSTGSAADDAGYSIATDSSGDIYVAGYFDSPSITFGTTTLTNAGSGTSDIFLVKYHPDGSVIGAIRAGGSLLDRCYSVKTDRHGNVYMAGFFQSSSITFGGYTLTKTGSNADIFVVKMNPSGTTLWACNSGVATNDVSVQSVAVDTFGNVYAVGYFGSPTLTFGTTVLTNAGSFPTNDMFIVKYNAAGSFVWAKRAGSTQDEIANSVSTDAAGNVYVTGYSQSASVTFGATTLTNAGASDMFLVKYDSSGNALWAKNSGSTNAMGQSTAVDTAGNVCVSGIFSSSTVTFGTTTLTNAGSGDAFLVKYTSGGGVTWAKSVGGTSSESGAGVHTDALANVYLTGYFFSPTLTIGSTALTNAGPANMYIAKYNSSGGVIYALSGTSYAAGGGGLGGISITTDPSAANVYVTGTLSGDSCSVGSTMLHNMGTTSNSDMFVARYGLPPTTSVQQIETCKTRIYPNPVNEELTVEFDPGNNGAGIFEMADVTGRIVFTKLLSNQKNKETINVRDLTPGLYLYKIVQNDVPASTGKIIKE